jgi:hypothetical protein
VVFYKRKKVSIQFSGGINKAISISAILVDLWISIW